MGEVIKFIVRIFLTALLVASVISALLIALPYVFNTAQIADSRGLLMGDSAQDALNELLRIVLKFVLMTMTAAIALAAVYVLAELMAILYRGKGLRAKYFKRVQTVILKSELDYKALFDLCEDAAMVYCMDVKAGKRRGVIEAVTKSKLTGLGEKVTIAVRRDGSVLISSKTTTRFASFYNTTTAGRNVKNVRALVGYVRKHSNDSHLSMLDGEISQPGMSGVRLSILTLCIGILNLLTVVGVTVGGVYVANDILYTPKDTEIPMSAPSGEQSMQDLVRENVQEMKRQLSFPIQVDETTILTDVSEGDGAVRYHVRLSGLEIDPSAESLKSYVVPNACQNRDVVEILNYMAIEYRVALSETGEEYQFIVDKRDCAKFNGNIL